MTTKEKGFGRRDNATPERGTKKERGKHKKRDGAGVRDEAKDRTMAPLGGVRGEGGGALGGRKYLLFYLKNIMGKMKAQARGVEELEKSAQKKEKSGSKKN